MAEEFEQSLDYFQRRYTVVRPSKRQTSPEALGVEVWSPTDTNACLTAWPRLAHLEH